MPSTLFHPTDDELERYLMDRTLHEEELARVEVHMIGCLECVERAEEMTEFITAVTEALQQVNAGGRMKYS